MIIIFCHFESIFFSFFNQITMQSKTKVFLANFNDFFIINLE